MKTIIQGKNKDAPCAVHSQKAYRMYLSLEFFLMKIQHVFFSLKRVLITLLFFGLIPVSQAYQPPIEFQETFNNIVTVQQVDDWAPGKNRTMTRLAMSGDGSRVAFVVALTYCGSEPVCWKLYVVNADGSNLIDLTPSSDIASITYLRMNYDGSRLFYRSPVFGNYTDIYYCEVDSKNCGVAVKDGLWRFDFRVPYSIDRNGENLYFKHDDGWDEDAKEYKRGLYTAQVGGSKSRVMDISELPCESECGNMNLLSFLGSSGSDNRLAFVYNRDYWGGDATGMWLHSDSGPALLGELHTYIWAVQDIFGHMLSNDGDTALYSFQDANSAEILNFVDLNSMQVTQMASSDKSGEVSGMTALSPDGRYARYQGHGYLTRVDRDDSSKRDLLSYTTKMRESLWSGRVSNFSEDNQRYFILNLKETTGAKLVRADIGDTDKGDAPVITNINFSLPALLHADDNTIGITLNVSDPQGLSDIESVRITTLVEGLEVPDFKMGREPLAFPSGDPGGTLLYDDASHGDEVAGDGVFSFDAIATRKGDYDGFNTFYSQFSLPHPVSIRVVAKDLSQNYTIVDVPLLITDNPQDLITDDPKDYATVVQDNLDLLLQPVDVYGQPYNVTLNRYINPEDFQGFYWKLGVVSMADSSLPGGTKLEDDLSISMKPANVFGVLYDVTLIPWQNRLDPFTLYWTLGTIVEHSE